MANEVRSKLEEAAQEGAAQVKQDVQDVKNAAEQRMAENNAVSESKIALPFRIFGGLSIAWGAGFIVVVVLFSIAFAQAAITKDWSTFNQVNTENQHLVISIVEVLAYAVEAVLFLVLGIRLVTNRRTGAGRISQVLIFFAIADMLLTIMSHGFGLYVIFTAVVLVFLVVMYTTLDPSLREERILQRKLKALEDKADQEEGTLGRDKTGKGFLKLDFFNIFWLFMIACVAGLIFESIVCPFLNGRIENRSGLLWGPFSPIYGFGAVLMVIALNRFWKKNPIIIYVVSGLIGGFFEWLVSYFFQFSFGILAWDYSGEPFNIDGRTDLFHMVCWGFLGLVFIKAIVPWVLGIINRIPWNWRYGVTAVCTALMIFNGAMTMLSFECWYSRVSGKPVETPVEQFFQQNFDDDFMKSHFATMSIDPSRTTRG